MATYSDSDMPSNSFIEAFLSKDTERSRQSSFQVLPLFIFVFNLWWSRKGDHLSAGLLLAETRLKRSSSNLVVVIALVVDCNWWCHCVVGYIFDRMILDKRTKDCLSGKRICLLPRGGEICGVGMGPIGQRDAEVVFFCFLAPTRQSPLTEVSSTNIGYSNKTLK